LADRLQRTETTVPRRDSRRGPGLHGGHYVQSVRGGVVTLDERHTRCGVVGAAAVARGDRETLDLGMQDLEPGQLLDGGVAARELVDAEIDHRTIGELDLQ